MLGAAGALVPEILTKAGLWNAPLWFDAGKAEYFAPASTLFLVELILFAWVSLRRRYLLIVVLAKSSLPGDASQMSNCFLVNSCSLEDLCRISSRCVDQNI
jgi:hypothetical protein